MIVVTCPECGSYTHCRAASGVIIAKCKLCREHVKNPVCLLTNPALKREEGDLCEPCKLKQTEAKNGN